MVSRVRTVPRGEAAHAAPVPGGTVVKAAVVKAAVVKAAVVKEGGVRPADLVFDPTTAC